MRKRVVISDDHPVVRAGIRMALEREPDFELVGEASDGQQAVQLVSELRPHVLVLDIEMPRMSGIEVTRHIHAAQWGTRILVLSAHDDAHYISTLLASGAHGYITKDEVYGEIVAAVRGVACQEKGWFSRRVAARMTAHLDLPSRSTPGLTEREHEVLGWLVRGKTNQGIAHTLSISEKTVERHLGSVFEKLGVASRVEAAVLAVRQQLV